jgi:glucosylceramidase
MARIDELRLMAKVARMSAPPRAEPAATNVTWVSTTETAPWQSKTPASGGRGGFGGGRDLDPLVDLPLQTVEGFGACFNELGWTSLQALGEADRQKILREMFAPGGGANFTLCRMPVGANDFSRDWYSYDETPDDFELRHFNIGNDLETLAPFIKGAQRYNPALQLWASPWSPPTWMKRNKAYWCRAGQPPAAPGGWRTRRGRWGCTG